MDQHPTLPAEAWIVYDGNTGNLRQAQALASALGVATRDWLVRPPGPWGWLAPHLRWGTPWALPAPFVAAAAAAAPTLVIGCGRRAALATAWLRSRHGSFAVQILNPRADTARWDVVVAPHHDGLTGPNVLSVTGALHAITPAALAAAALQHADLARIPEPRTAVLIGGPTRAARLDRAWLETLCAHLAAWHAADGGGFLISTSRRTPAAWLPRLRALTASLPTRLWTQDSEGINPYLGMLAHAQRLVVSPDSANLMTEACATGKPVFVATAGTVRGRIGALHQELLVAGRIRPLRDSAPTWTPAPVPREAARIAAEITRRFAARSA